MTNPRCPWDTAIVIHSWWKGALRWYASSLHAVWVGLKAAEELSFCSAHRPSWADDIQFEQAVQEVLEAGRSKASGSSILGIDANCNFGDNDDLRGSLVKDLCTGQGLLPLFQRDWTFAWLPPARGTRKKKIDIFFTNQLTSCASIAENLRSKSDHKPLRSVWCHAGVRVKTEVHGGLGPTNVVTAPQLAKLYQHTVLGSTVGQFPQAFEKIMGEVGKRGSFKSAIHCLMLRNGSMLLAMISKFWSRPRLCRSSSLGKMTPKNQWSSKSLGDRNALLRN